MYTIGQVSKMTGLPVSTLRYYDREGLFPDLERDAGIRQFSEAEIEIIKTIDCLKKSGLEIKAIRQFLEWAKQGESTFPDRLELLETQREAMKEEMAKLEQTLAMIDYKCWYFSKAIEVGEAAASQISPEQMAAEIRQAWEVMEGKNDE